MSNNLFVFYLLLVLLAGKCKQELNSLGKWGWDRGRMMTYTIKEVQNSPWISCICELILSPHIELAVSELSSKSMDTTHKAFYKIM